MIRNDSTSLGFCESLAHYMAALLERREFGAAIGQYELNRVMVEEVGGAAAASVLLAAAKASIGQNDLRSALRLARSAQSMASGEGDGPLLAEIFVVLGDVLRDMSEPREAEKAYRDAESIFRRGDQPDGQCRALNHLAGLFFRRHDFRNALGVLLDALEIARTLGDKTKLAYMMGNIGRIYTFIGAMAEAEKHLQINIELSAAGGDTLEVAKARLSLGYIYIQQAEYGRAGAELEEAHRLLQLTPSRRDEVIYLTYLGELQYRMGRNDESRVTLDRALALAEETAPASTLTARVLRHLAELSVRVRNFRHAQRYVHRALALFSKTEDKVESGALWKLKGAIAEANGDSKEAVAAFKKGIDLLGESGVRFEKAEALVVAGNSSLFSVRERMTYLFRAEEYYSRAQMPNRLAEVGRIIGDLELESAQGGSCEQPGQVGVPGVEYITANPRVRQFLAQIPILGRSDLPVLITGETGVGKDHLARYYHSVVRPGRPYVAINCASLPEQLLESELFGYRRGAFTGAETNKPGLFVAANGGVLLLDEIGDMPLSLQAKLLGVLEKRKLTPLGSTTEIDLDIRVIAATNRDLEAMVEQGTFRRDLYFRLSGIAFALPPLRDRKEDIPLLMEQFMRKRKLLADGDRLPIDLIRQFMEYDWPGNIRELDNIIKRLEVMAHMVAEGDLVELSRSIFGSNKVIPSKGTLFDRVLEFERRLIIEALQIARGNKCEAARILGVHEATVRMKLKRYGISGMSNSPN